MCERCNSDPHALSRRSVLGGAAAALALSGLPLAKAFADQPASLSPALNAIPPAEALRRLMQGNARYAHNKPSVKDFSAGRAARVSAQYPFAAVLGCSDSRVAPELAFDQGPGQIFTVRLAGNFVNDDGLASLEYAVEFLKVPLLFILGHSKCGAVDAAIKVLKQGTTLPGHLPELIESIKPAVDHAEKRHPVDLLKAAINENVRLNIQRLTAESPLLKAAVMSKKIAVAGGVYELANGKVTLL